MTSTVTITLTQDDAGNLTAATDLAAPRIGAPLSPVQMLGLQLLNALQRHAVTPIHHGMQHVPALAALQELISPEQLGWQVPGEIRQCISQLLSNGQPPQPTATSMQ